MNLQVPTFSIPNNFGDSVFQGINHLLPRLPSAAFNLALGIILIRLLVKAARKVFKAFGMAPGLRGVVASIFETVLWIFLTINLLNDLGFQGVIYFFSGSIAAIGLAMAAGGSTLVSDIIAGVFLARDQDFNVGDEVIAGETPTQGVIERMDARRTRLRGEDGVLHIIPNSVVERKEWIVVKRRAEISALARAGGVAKRLGVKALEKEPAKRQIKRNPKP